MSETVLLLILAIFLIVISIPTFYAGFIGAPLVFTPKGAIRKALRKAGARKGEKFYDLGCGTGRTLIISDKEFGLKTVGFELSPIIYFIAKINIFLNSAKNSEIRMQNAYNQNLSDADIVFCFLSVDPMEKLKSKFLRELKSGARIISYSFKIKGWEPEETITGYPGNVYIYRVG